MHNNEFLSLDEEPTDRSEVCHESSPTEKHRSTNKKQREERSYESIRKKNSDKTICFPVRQRRIRIRVLCIPLSFTDLFQKEKHHT